ncbi:MULTISPECIES: hypothetical protein [Xanthomonas]|uniref:Uncharacterized protein n=1 Tax=Xanthomonas cannabis TaxID=1885674 RepID=A0ABR6JPV0_9XANT|nr:MULTISPECIES: hypothetical protein [Xanthomonas]MBB4594850.1 hypothetical protein [Xanthomonas cannabis]MBB5523666.1 hypothetical protein [Xanthomonas cannabis]MBO9855836.1 hypothetical protein [Xanthomonas sp. A1809]MBZ2621155.1 hypothetical protein [Xanthomonas perforans]
MRDIADNADQLIQDYFNSLGMVLWKDLTPDDNTSLRFWHLSLDGSGEDSSELVFESRGQVWRWWLATLAWQRWLIRIARICTHAARKNHREAQYVVTWANDANRSVRMPSAVEASMAAFGRRRHRLASGGLRSGHLIYMPGSSIDVLVCRIHQHLSVDGELGDELVWRGLKRQESSNETRVSFWRSLEAAGDRGAVAR